MGACGVGPSLSDTSGGAPGPLRKARPFCFVPVPGKGQGEATPSKPGFLTNHCLASTQLRIPREYNYLCWSSWVDLILYQTHQFILKCTIITLWQQLCSYRKTLYLNISLFQWVVSYKQKVCKLSHRAVNKRNYLTFLLK